MKALKPASKQLANSGWDTSAMSDRQKQEAEAIHERIRNRPARPKVKIETDDEGKIALLVGEGSDAAKALDSMRLHEIAGSASDDFAGALLHRLFDVTKRTGEDGRDSEKLTAAMALIGGIAPQNELEATMALQMVAANEATLNSFRTAQLNGGCPEIAAAYSNMANKAMRSFALHAEALSKLRRNGEQVVKHVHVNEGGQAVIAGTLNTGGGR